MIQDPRKPFSKSVITCSEPGCTNTIAYDSTTISVSLYCRYHKTEEGRHSQVRPLRFTSEKPPDKVDIQNVIFRCAKCHNRTEIHRSDWLKGIVPDCCEQHMIFHKDAEFKSDVQKNKCGAER